MVVPEAAAEALQQLLVAMEILHPHPHHKAIMGEQEIIAVELAELVEVVVLAELDQTAALRPEVTEELELPLLYLDHQLLTLVEVVEVFKAEALLELAAQVAVVQEELEILLREEQVLLELQTPVAVVVELGDLQLLREATAAPAS